MLPARSQLNSFYHVSSLRLWDRNEASLQRQYLNTAYSGISEKTWQFFLVWLLPCLLFFLEVADLSSLNRDELTVIFRVLWGPWMSTWVGCVDAVRVSTDVSWPERSRVQSRKLPFVITRTCQPEVFDVAELINVIVRYKIAITCWKPAKPDIHLNIQVSRWTDKPKLGLIYWQTLLPFRKVSALYEHIVAMFEQ